MATFVQSMQSGQRAESSLLGVLMKYTNTVFTNVRVETLLTKKGNTEIDIIASISDYIVIIESKNISRIDGDEDDVFWNYTGSSGEQIYNSLSALAQNRIHVRALKDAWFYNYNRFPQVISYVVVPNDCEYADSLFASGVITAQFFEEQISSLARMPSSGSKTNYELEALVNNFPWLIKRGDLNIER